MGINSILAAKKERNVDIVFCIDGTGSMHNCIDNVKNHARSLCGDFKAKMRDLGSDITSLRVRVIIFRDYKSDSDAMECSRFFDLDLDSDKDAYEEFLSNVTAHGGCGEDANGLEALYFAMKSDFVTGDSDRQVIVMFADTPAINLLRRQNCQGYAKGMVDYNGLKEMWEGLNQTTRLKDRNKRLVIFAPAGSNYEKMRSEFKKTTFEVVSPSNGMKEISFDSLLQTIAKSASSQ